MARQRQRVADSVEDALRGVAGVVNASPVGMLPSVDTPVPDTLLHAGLWVADAVYSPLWTPLLTAAKANGARVMTGRDLAIYQAADAFELFTGLTPVIAELGNGIRRRDGKAIRRGTEIGARDLLPSSHAPLRVGGGGSGVGVRLRKLAGDSSTNLRRHPHPRPPPRRAARGRGGRARALRCQLPLNELYPWSSQKPPL